MDIPAQTQPPLWQFVRAPVPPRETDPEFEPQLLRHSQALNQAGVESVLLVHGTFLGNDVGQWGLLLERFSAAAARPWRRTIKYFSDVLTGDRGNFPSRTLRFWRQVLRQEQTPLHVERFCWSGENTHTARVDAALRLLPQLAAQSRLHQGKLLLAGHSHGGNVLAVLCHLLSGEEAGEEVLRAVAPLYRRGAALRHLWQQAMEARELLQDQEVLRRLVLVTLGTPVRYAWPQAARGRLLHLLYRVPQGEKPESLQDFRRTGLGPLRIWAGDVIQQLGTSGSNFPPGLFLSWKVWRAEWALSQVLDRNDSWWRWPRNLVRNSHWPQAGALLVIDYGKSQRRLLRGMWGHAAYTRLRWLPWHLEQWARWLQGELAQPGASQGKPVAAA